MMFNTSGEQRDREKHEIQRLVDQALAGRQDAFEEIVFRFRDQVYATAWHLTHNTEDAFDVTQEAFLRAYRALSSYKGRSQFSTWLHRIVLNTGIDYIRREKRHRHISTDDRTGPEDNARQENLQETVEPTQRTHIYNVELQRKVLSALDELSARQRQVFMLRYYHELDTKETATVLKCTEGSVKRHLFRAQNRLKELLSDLRLPDHGK
jgi:RNA polymerase sigma-70 factor (ECF subfamily)